MIDAKDIVFSYGAGKVLNGATLRAQDGEFVALLGGNGAGKSTLVKVLSGSVKAQSGKVFYGELDISGASARELAKRRAVLSQDDALSFDYTVEQVVRLGGYARGDNRNDEKYLEAALRASGVEKLRERIYTELSGGEKRRVMIARAIFQIGDEDGARGKNLLLDEPSAGLDPARAHEAMRASKRIAEAGAAVVAVLHEPNLALSYADKTALLKDGKIFAFGKTRDVLSAENLSIAYGAKCEIIRSKDDGKIFINFPAI